MVNDYVKVFPHLSFAHFHNMFHTPSLVFYYGKMIKGSIILRWLLHKRLKAMPFVSVLGLWD